MQQRVIGLLICALVLLSLWWAGGPGQGGTSIEPHVVDADSTVGNNTLLPRLSNAPNSTLPRNFTTTAVVRTSEWAQDRWAEVRTNSFRSTCRRNATVPGEFAVVLLRVSIEGIDAPMASGRREKWQSDFIKNMSVIASPLLVLDPNASSPFLYACHQSEGNLWGYTLSCAAHVARTMLTDRHRGLAVIGMPRSPAEAVAVLQRVTDFAHNVSSSADCHAAVALHVLANKVLSASTAAHAMRRIRAFVAQRQCEKGATDPQCTTGSANDEGASHRPLSGGLLRWLFVPASHFALLGDVASAAVATGVPANLSSALWHPVVALMNAGWPVPPCAPSER
jgi:hypothetical protein